MESVMRVVRNICASPVAGVCKSLESKSFYVSLYIKLYIQVCVFYFL
jgi:hypothetical protein